MLPITSENFFHQPQQSILHRFRVSQQSASSRVFLTRKTSPENFFLSTSKHVIKRSTPVLARYLCRSFGPSVESSRWCIQYFTRKKLRRTLLHASAPFPAHLTRLDGPGRPYQTSFSSLRRGRTTLRISGFSALGFTPRKLALRS